MEGLGWNSNRDIEKEADVYKKTPEYLKLPE